MRRMAGGLSAVVAGAVASKRRADSERRHREHDDEEGESAHMATTHSLWSTAVSKMSSRSIIHLNYDPARIEKRTENNHEHARALWIRGRGYGTAP